MAVKLYREPITQDEHITYHFQAKNFYKEIGDFWYFHICSGLLFCDSLCRSAANYLNYFQLLRMFASVKSFSKVERGNQ